MEYQEEFNLLMQEFKGGSYLFNITNLSNNQKKLIVDESFVPKVPVIDYAVPLTAELVDEYMGSILHAARTGDLTMVKNL